MSYVKDIDRGWKQIQKQLHLLDKSYVKVGVLSNSGGYEKGGKASLADVATWNEFGTSKIPPRPFLAQSYDNNKTEVEEFKKKQFGAVLDLKQSTSRALETIGVYFKGKVQKEIASGEFAENAQATIDQKGSSKPLIHTRRLGQSIDFELVLK